MRNIKKYESFRTVTNFFVCFMLKMINALLIYNVHAY